MGKLSLSAEISKIIGQHQKKIMGEIVQAISKYSTKDDPNTGVMTALRDKEVHSDALFTMPHTGEEISYRVTIKFGSSVNPQVAEAMGEKMKGKPTSHQAEMVGLICLFFGRRWLEMTKNHSTCKSFLCSIYNRI